MSSSAGTPIFVGGSGRCGTTVLVNTLGLHPRIFTFPDELRLLTAGNENLLDWMHSPRSEQLGRAIRQGLRGGFFSRTALRDLIRTPKHASIGSRYRQLSRGSFFSRPVARNEREVGLCRALEVHEYERAVERLLESFPAASIEESKQHIREFMEDCARGALARTGAVRWCDGTPDNVLHMFDLAAIFPGARFVHIVRNGKDVANSFYRLGWSPSTTAALRQWHHAVGTARALGAELGPQQYIEVEFEQVLEDPEPTLRRVVEFVSEDWHPALEAHTISRAAVTEQSDDEDPDLDRLFAVLASSLADDVERSGA